MFETKGKLDLAKQKLLRLFRGLGKEDSNASSSGPILSVAPYELEKRLLNRSLEAELKKAEALIYLRMSDRPR